MSDGPRKRQIEFLLISCALIIILSLASFNISSFLSKKEVLGATSEDGQENLLQEKIYWENFLSQNPNYIPGWLELSKINGALGNGGEALENLYKINQIDPNYQKPY